MRQTSIDTYNQIKESGLLGNQRMMVYETLYTCGPSTAGELSRCLDSIEPRHMVSKRLPELRDMGIVDELGTRPCTVSGRNSIVWSTNGNMVEKLPPKPKNERKCKSCSKNERIIDNLRKAYVSMRDKYPAAAELFADEIKKRS